MLKRARRIVRHIRRHCRYEIISRTDHRNRRPPLRKLRPLLLILPTAVIQPGQPGRPLQSITALIRLQPPVNFHPDRNTQLPQKITGRRAVHRVRSKRLRRHNDTANRPLKVRRRKQYLPIPSTHRITIRYTVLPQPLVHRRRPRIRRKNTLVRLENCCQCAFKNISHSTPSYSSFSTITVMDFSPCL